MNRAVQSRADPCVFRKFAAGKMEAILAVYVDDLLALTVTKEAMETFVRELRSTLKIKDLGGTSYYMGCHITRDRAKKVLKFDQHIYARTITERFGIGETAMVPVTEGVKPLSKEHGLKTTEEKEEMTKIPYREAVGALMCTSTMTRPDISSAVRSVAKFCENPGMAHWKAVAKILQFVRRTPERGIIYGGDGNGRAVMRVFVDLGHATCLDTRRSTSGGAVLLGGGAISWFSGAQVTTAEGTSEAEYVAMSEIVKEVQLSRQIKAFIMPALKSNPVDIVEDNQGAIKTANDRHSSKRARHIDIKHHLIRDAVNEGKVRVTYVKTEDQHADVLTKPLGDV